MTPTLSLTGAYTLTASQDPDSARTYWTTRENVAYQHATAYATADASNLSRSLAGLCFHVTFITKDGPAYLGYARCGIFHNASDTGSED